MLPAWNLFGGWARQVFREASGADEARGRRGRAWALSIAVVALPYYRDTFPATCASSRRVLTEVLAEHEREALGPAAPPRTRSDLFEVDSFEGGLIGGPPDPRVGTPSFGAGVRPARDVVETAWVRTGQARGQGDAAYGVGQFVPEGFERVLFVDDVPGDQDAWWELEKAHTMAIAEVAARHTTTPDHVFFRDLGGPRPRRRPSERQAVGEEVEVVDVPVPVGLGEVAAAVVEGVGGGHVGGGREHHAGKGPGSSMGLGAVHEEVGDAVPTGVGGDAEHAHFDLAGLGDLRERCAVYGQGDRADEAQAGDRDEDVGVAYPGGAVAELLGVRLVDHPVAGVGLEGEDADLVALVGGGAADDDGGGHPGFLAPAPGQRATLGVIADDPTDALDLDAALDVLFSTAPDAFVAERNALVKQLRAAKRREEATAVAALRKPPRAVWALNHLALSDDPHLADLLDAIDAVAAADAAAHREAVAAVRDRIGDTVDAAVAAIEAPRSDDHPDVTGALQAVVGVAEALRLLVDGRLVEVPAGGMGALGLLPPGGNAVPRVPRPEGRARPKLGVPRPPASPEESQEDAVEQEEGAEAEVDDSMAARRAARERRRLEKEAASARSAQEAAAAALERAEGAVAQAEEALASADDEVTAAEAALAAVRARRDEQDAALAEARSTREDAIAAEADARAAADAARAELDALDP